MGRVFTKMYKELTDIIKTKKTRLCFSADFTSSKELVEWIHKVGDHICLLKTHIDILEDFEEDLIETLNTLKKQYNFLILEDRKFSDIGKTFHKQLCGGIYRISGWADIVTIHGISSKGMLHYLNTMPAASPKILIVSQMSSKDNIIDSLYTSKCYEIAKQFPSVVVGFICQNRFVDDATFLFASPGVSIEDSTDKDQQYKTPQQAFKNGSDIIIVGGAIYKHSSPLTAIQFYK